MLEDEALKRDPADRSSFGPLKFNQMFQPYHLDDRRRQVEAGGWIEVKRVRCFIQKPLARSIQFFKDVLHIAVLFVHRARTVVLPSAFQG
jgi:hypothetical protein